MSHTSYKIFLKNEYRNIINDLVNIINNKYYKIKKQGRPLKIPIINIVKGIIYILKTGCQWYMIPKEFGNYSTIYKHYLKFVRDNIFSELWTNKVKQLTHKRKSNLKNILIDCTLIKSINGCDTVGRNPCDRGRYGTKISLITSENGAPLGMAINGANIADSKMMQDTFDNLKVKRKRVINLYADKGYSNGIAKKCANQNGFRLVCENKKNAKIKLFRNRKHKVNHIRYVVEATFSWIKKYRRLILRYDRKVSSYIGFLMLSFSIIIQRMI